jgi:hypothetical protein
MPTPPADVVARWLDAVNAGDAERLVSLSAPDIRILGPRGIARGAEVLRAWLERAGLRLDARSVFARDARVVVLQHAVWRDPDSGGPRGAAEVASRFVVEGGRVAEYERHDALDEALARAELTVDDWT